MEESTGWRDYCFKPENALSGNSVRLLRNGDGAFAGILKVLRAAQKYLLLEFYCFADDLVGRIFRTCCWKKPGRA